MERAKVGRVLDLLPAFVNVLQERDELERDLTFSLKSTPEFLIPHRKKAAAKVAQA